MNEPSRKSWQKIRAIIHDRILNRQYRPGDKLPRDEDLAREFGSARTTVHRAMRSLAEDGIVMRRRKGGTTVAGDGPTHARLEIPVTRREVEAQGAVYGYRLLSCGVADAPDWVTKTIGSVDQTMLNVRALHLADDRPYQAEDRWVNLAVAPGIAELDLSRQSANEWLLENQPFDRCLIDVTARIATSLDADLLAVSPGAALLAIDRATWINDAPVNHVRVLSPPGHRLRAES